MNRLVIALIFLASSFVFAQSETVKKIDLNKNGKMDRFEYFMGEKLIRIEEDRNGDGRIDFKTFFDHKTYYQIELQDADYDGKFERKRSYLALPGHKSKLINELDKNGDGIYEIKYNSVSSNIQKQSCEQKIVDAEILELSKASLKAVAKSQNGLLPTGLGYKVDQACYSKWGNDFNKILKDSVQGGLKCLSDLDKKVSDGKTVSGALRNAYGLTQIMENDGISLMCSESDYDWSGTAGHASVTSMEKIKGPDGKDLPHPFLSINPNDPKTKAPTDARELLEFKKTIFHETLHNLGYRHNEDMEYSYTCETCCFGEESKEVKDNACKLCTGNYKNINDITYIQDFLEFSQLNYMEKRGVTAVTNYLKENDKSVGGISMMAYATSGVFNPIGSELGKIISSNNLNPSEADKKYLDKAKDTEYYAGLSKTTTSSKAIASTIYELYYNKSDSAALDNLEKNKEAIKKELDELKKDTKDHSKYVYEDMKKVLDNVIDDMWLNKYPSGDVEGNKSPDRAYELYKFFED